MNGYCDRAPNRSVGFNQLEEHQAGAQERFDIDKNGCADKPNPLVAAFGITAQTPDEQN